MNDTVETYSTAQHTADSGDDARGHVPLSNERAAVPARRDDDDQPHPASSAPRSGGTLAGGLAAVDHQPADQALDAAPDATHQPSSHEHRRHRHQHHNKHQQQPEHPSPAEANEHSSSAPTNSVSSPKREASAKRRPTGSPTISVPAQGAPPSPTLAAPLRAVEHSSGTAGMLSTPPSERAPTASKHNPIRSLDDDDDDADAERADAELHERLRQCIKPQSLSPREQKQLLKKDFQIIKTKARLSEEKRAARDRDRQLQQQQFERRRREQQQSATGLLASAAGSLFGRLPAQLGSLGLPPSKQS
eukprot:TRINITY_DN18394_c0_g1_i1.p1 TRINITY_DN18394_c0_g1~~TRINITY_DN18394_c0_g1_i1.p1  ORF type:complete len:304 (-),score=59.68 TRINITY_DN18394_c0_g1_i1:185-1096(-)